ncbi:MAG: ribosomal protein S18-alanine N-acetyltransferase [Candidatus Sedimenticola sp. (ex Thyasira tokunagai)]
MSDLLKDPLLKIRPMTNDDVEAVMVVELCCYEFPWTEGIFRDSLRVGYNCWVSTLGERIIGYGVVSVAVGEAHLLNLCTHPDFQGQGVAGRLLQHLMTVARKREADTLFLEVRASNKVAIGLYESIGFNEIGRRRGYYPDQQGREDAIILAYSL